MAKKNKDTVADQQPVEEPVLYRRGDAYPTKDGVIMYAAPATPGRLRGRLAEGDVDLRQRLKGVADGVGAGALANGAGDDHLAAVARGEREARRHRVGLVADPAGAVRVVVSRREA